MSDITKVTVFGLGAIGSNLMIQLLRQYPDMEYKGVDFDTIEDRNIRIQAYYNDQVKQPKALALRAVGHRYVRKFKYTAHNKKIDGKFTDTPGPSDLWVDCFDNSLSRQLLVNRGGDNANILHLGFSPHYTAEFMWNDGYDVPGEVDPDAPDICALHDAACFIHFFVSRAVLEIAEFMNNGHQRNFLVTGKSNVRYL